MAGGGVAQRAHLGIEHHHAHGDELLAPPHARDLAVELLQGLRRVPELTEEDPQEVLGLEGGDRRLDAVPGDVADHGHDAGRRRAEHVVEVAGHEPRARAVEGAELEAGELGGPVGRQPGGPAPGAPAPPGPAPPRPAAPAGPGSRSAGRPGGSGAPAGSTRPPGRRSSSPSQSAHPSPVKAPTARTRAAAAYRNVGVEVLEEGGPGQLGRLGARSRSASTTRRSTRRSRRAERPHTMLAATAASATTASIGRSTMRRSSVPPGPAPGLSGAPHAASAALRRSGALSRSASAPAA